MKRAHQNHQIIAFTPLLYEENKEVIKAMNNNPLFFAAVRFLKVKEPAAQCGK
jgi:predicted 2-oxoglutarate/Fe(II)-dependent dioxygenase YbiX